MAGKYYVIIDGGRQGPFTREQLESQGLRRETLVWRKGLADWLAAGRVAELLDIFDEPPPVPSAAPVVGPSPGPASDQFKDPAVNLARAEIGRSSYDDPDRDFPLPPGFRIPYDRVGLRRVYVGAMWTYVPGLTLILLGLVAAALLGIYELPDSAPRFDPQRRDVVFDFDPGARTVRVLCGVATAAAIGLGLLSLVAGIVCFCVLHYRAWAVIQDGRVKTTPGQATGFLFIPFFNTYWAFVAVWGLARALNRFVRRYDLDAPAASQPLGFAIGLYVAMLYIPAPFVGFVPLALVLVLLPFFMRSVYRTVAAVCDDANRQRVAQASLDPFLRQPERPRPVAAHVLSIAAEALAPIALAMLVIGFCTNLNALRHYHRDARLNEADRQAVQHLRGLAALNGAEQNRLLNFQNRINNWERFMQPRWTEHLIVSGALLGGGLLLLAVVLTLAFLARQLARARDEADLQPPVWPVAQGAGLLSKNASSP